MKMKIGVAVFAVISAGLLNQKRPPWLALVVDLRGGNVAPDLASSLPEPRASQGNEMLDNCGVKNIRQYDNHWAPGRDIHEMGGCRMGKDPKTSLLNGHNQFHHCKNVYVTDGACMTSTANQSPSILYMALTARAAHHAVEEMKKGNL